MTTSKKPTAERRTLSLRVHVVTLSIALLLLTAVLLGWVGYRHAAAILWSASARLTQQIAANVDLSVGVTYGPASIGVELLAESALARAGDTTARRATLPLLARVLESGPEIAAVYAGYDDGDFFILRRLSSTGVRDRIGGPAGAAYAADSIEGAAHGSRAGERQFLDASLAEIARQPLDDVSLDPRERPWYRRALDASTRVLTDPYRFHLSGAPGVTTARRFGDGSGVVAADVTLETLSGTLEAQRITPSAELVLVDDEGGVLAYSGATPRASAADGAALPRLESLPSAVMREAAGRLEPGSEALHLDVSGRRWLGRMHRLPTRAERPWYLAVLVAEDELLADATRLLERSTLWTLGIVAALVPFAFLIANFIAGPLLRLAGETRVIRRFDFRAPIGAASRITEVRDLATAMNEMKVTIARFLDLIGSLSREPAYDRLLDRVLDETMLISGAGGGVVYLLDDDGATLEPASTRVGAHGAAAAVGPVLLRDPDTPSAFVTAATKHQVEVLQLERDRAGRGGPLEAMHAALGADRLVVTLVPLSDRRERPMGVLCLLSEDPGDPIGAAGDHERVAFVHALSGFAAVSLESQRLLQMEKALLDAFIRLIAGAIDAKSPYTGGHCQRVPELTLMLARAACDSDAAPFASFHLDGENWEALRIAAWLHDCGKVTTPEYVVDKATKLETIHDRIHEVRMRFEVLKRDAEIRHWRRVAQGEDEATSRTTLDAEWDALDADFAFVGECNEGGEFMAPDRVERLRTIAARGWTRTLDDRIGVSWAERERKARTPAPALPVDEPLLADRDEHLIARGGGDEQARLDALGFHVEVPEHEYNRGELHNLSVARGTLSAEERFKINDHIVQTIAMLEQLPFPKHLREVPAIAGGHHEKMDGTGYPRRLTRDDMPLTARMMAIADVFEALTASDRPYKKAKTLAEAVRIMSFMKADAHVDPDLFDLFLTSGVYREYADRYLDGSQIDEVDVDAYVTPRGRDAAPGR